MSQTSHAQLTFEPEFAGRLDGIAEFVAPNRYRYSTAVGSVSWRRDADGSSWTYTVQEETGFNVLGVIDTDRFIGLDAEQTAFDARPISPELHGRPYAYDSLSQIFDDPKVPNAVAVPAPGFPLHGNIGNHGSLASVQSRGMFIACGAGVRKAGWVDDHARVIDVAPTLLALLGAPTIDCLGSSGKRRKGRLLAQDGSEIQTILSKGKTATRVVAIVLDGCNTNLLADAIDAGDVPNLAKLLNNGIGLRHGIVSSFPTVTLPNHMSAFTGLHPGRHGVINNEFVDHDGNHVNLLDVAEMPYACDWFHPGVETVHEAVHRIKPDAFTSSCFEYMDRGADWSTYDDYRTRGRVEFPGLEETCAQSSPEGWDHQDHGRGYRFMSRVDETSLRAAIRQWNPPQMTGHELPTLQLVNLSLTDSSGHAVGPLGDLARFGLIDSDRRVGRLIKAIEDADAYGETAFVILSDHGMDQCDADLENHMCADLSAFWSAIGRREIGDVFLYPVAEV
jgi:phosphonoacetate hydrolase